MDDEEDDEVLSSNGQMTRNLILSDKIDAVESHLDIVEDDVIRCHTMSYDVIQCHMMSYNAIQSHTMSYNVI